MDFVIKEIYTGFEAVYVDDVCIGVVLLSRKYPYRKMFFAYDDSQFYYGNTSITAVRVYFESK